MSLASNLPACVAATQAFLQALRQEALRRNPDLIAEDCAIPIWDAMSPAERGLVLRPIQRAIAMAEKIAAEANSPNR